MVLLKELCRDSADSAYRSDACLTWARTKGLIPTFSLPLCCSHLLTYGGAQFLQSSFIQPQDLSGDRVESLRWVTPCPGRWKPPGMNASCWIYSLVDHHQVYNGDSSGSNCVHKREGAREIRGGSQVAEGGPGEDLNPV